MNNDKYISPRHITKQFNITSGTLRLWAENGKIRYIRPNQTGGRLYNANDIEKIFGSNSTFKNQKTICYARVSSIHQKHDLERQESFLRERFPNSIIVKDIGSGLNWKRKGFCSILEQVIKGDIEKIVVTYKDRLCRFGIELVEWLFKKFNVKLLVLSQNIDQKDISRELAEDLLAITTVFVARNNGLRAGAYRRQRKEASIRDEEGENSGGENQIN